MNDTNTKTFKPSIPFWTRGEDKNGYPNRTVILDDEMVSILRGAEVGTKLFLNVYETDEGSNKPSARIVIGDKVENVRKTTGRKPTTTRDNEL